MRPSCFRAVSQCGELDIDLADHTAPSGATSTINGDIVIQASAACTSPAFSGVDIWTARINGQVSVIGNYLGGPSICGNEITGNVTIDHVTAAHPFWIGDPDGIFGCPGNTIGNTLSVSKSSALEVESNSVGGSVLLSGSTLELNENTIGGSLRCSNGTVILPGEGSDPVRQHGSWSEHLLTCRTSRAESVGGSHAITPVLRIPARATRPPTRGSALPDDRRRHTGLPGRQRVTHGT
jgi:hypothetical protein